jgi:malate dehydrogenase (quinone)
MHFKHIPESKTDVLLIGAGIMSSTLAVMLSHLDPDLKIETHETLEHEAEESSNVWNNAGTGHAALCEMNYTKLQADGSIDISAALRVNTQFDLSRQFWAYLVKNHNITDPKSFIHTVPHHSFVIDKDVDFLKKRYTILSEHHCFAGMEYSEDRNQITEWAPLITQGRSSQQKVAMTRMFCGTDVNFGSLTSALLASLNNNSNFTSYFSSHVDNIKRDGKEWKVKIKDLTTGKHRLITAKFVFIGAGGAAVNLLHKSGVPEGKYYAGCPVSGLWLRCDNQAICKQHDAKVYSKAALGAPPMSVPHLDRRYIDGKLSLLFGPFAGFTTKFLKNGSYFDLFRSFDHENMIPLFETAMHNTDLLEFLIGQVTETPEERFAELQTLYPDAVMDDWQLQHAGQRVQIVKPDKEQGGVLAFGTELVGNNENTLLALLGASPGASTAVAIMIQVIERCFPQLLSNTDKIKQLIPSYGHSLVDDPQLCQKIRTETSEILQLVK